MPMTLDWTSATVDTNGDGTTTVTSGTDSVNVSVSGNGTVTDQYYSSGDYYRPPAGVTSEDSTSFQFSSAVENVSFEIFDVDQGGWDDLIEVVALDDNGNEVPVIFSNLTHHTVNGNSVEGDGALDTGGTGAQDAVTVTIPSSIVSLSLNFKPGPDGTRGGGIGYSDLTFDISAPACFTTGMEIETINGPIAVEHLKAGDLVWTHDNGFQPIMFVYSKRVVARGEMCPVVFETGSIGNSANFVVSQRHRMYVSSLPMRIRRRFGRHQDTLVQARDLVGHNGIRLGAEFAVVEYFHIMFRDHQLVHSQGTISESWQPTRAALKSDPEIGFELLNIFPDIVSRKCSSEGALIRHEVQLKKTA